MSFKWSSYLYLVLYYLLTHNGNYLFTQMLTFCSSVTQYILYKIANCNCNLIQHVVWDGRLRPGAATWRTGRNIRIVVDSAYSLHYIKTCRHPQNRKDMSPSLRGIIRMVETGIRVGSVPSTKLERLQFSTRYRSVTISLNNYFAHGQHVGLSVCLSVCSHI